MESISRTLILKKITSKLHKNEARKCYYFHVNRASISIYLIRHNLIRIKVQLHNTQIPQNQCFDKQQESYAVVLTAWQDRLDTLMKDYRVKIQPLFSSSPREDHEFYQLGTEQLHLKIWKNPFGFQIRDLDGNLLHSDLKEKPMMKDHKGRVYHYCNYDPAADCYYGFGQNSGKFNKKQQRMYQAPKDSLGYDAESTSPLYKHIPFYIRLNKNTKKAIGYFYDNSYQSYFDMGCQRSGYYQRYTYFQAQGGDIDLYFIYGPSIKRVVQTYTDLTGKTCFCPMSALGYLGSTMYYAELPKECDKAIYRFIEKCRNKSIPINNFHLSSGYTMNQEYQKRFVFTWNKQKFPNPSQFFTHMNKNLKVLVSPNLKPGILQVHPYYEQLSTKEAFIKNYDGKKPYIDRWWGGQGSFIDFTSQNGREGWKKYLKKEIIEKGTFSIWNDNNQYESLLDKNAYCSFQGKGSTIQRLKPIQSLMMSHLTMDALKEADEGIRPYIVSRSGYAGIQRYSSTWSGDNYTTWKTIKYNIGTVLNMGLSGVANYGCDIGGFWGPAPTEELFVRWVQNGIFQPRFSIHSCNSDNTVTQPFMFESSTHLISSAIQFRYSLMPYLYSLLYNSSQTGQPIMRPLVYQFQDDENCYNEGYNFMFGPYMLIANVLQPLEKSSTRQIYLPAGCDWIDYHSKPYKKYEGGSKITLPITIQSIPIMIRGNSIIPSIQGYSDKLEQYTRVKLLISYQNKTSQQKTTFELYEDDKVSNDYKSQIWHKTSISVKWEGDSIRIDCEKKGKYTTGIQEWVIELVSLEKAPFHVIMKDQEHKAKGLELYLGRQQWYQNDKKAGYYYNHESKSIFMRFHNPLGDFTIDTSFSKIIEFSKEYKTINKATI